MSLSLLPSLRASSSRLVYAPVGPALARRQFHASPPRSAVGIGTTVQSVDKALSDLKRSASQLKKTGKNLDMTAMATPTLERSVDPAFKFGWLFRAKGRKYARERFMRYRTTRQCLNDMIQANLFAKKKGSNVISSMVQGILCISPTHKASYALEDVRKVYEKLNEAQAAGDEIAVRSLATGEALALAQKIAKTKRNMTWKLVKMNAEPKLVSARLAPLDAEGLVGLAQVVVKFDSDQALTTVDPKKGSQTKQQRVVENCVFERHTPSQRGWRLKETLDVSPPDI